MPLRREDMAFYKADHSAKLFWLADHVDYVVNIRKQKLLIFPLCIQDLINFTPKKVATQSLLSTHKTRWHIDQRPVRYTLLVRLVRHTP